MEQAATDPLDALTAGVAILNDLMKRHAFCASNNIIGRGSGGTFASTEFTRGDRKLEIHFRYNLGLVTYHVGKVSLSHEDYMWSVIGKRWASHYPGFSKDPLNSFRDLRQDLEEYGAAFLSGTDADFLRFAEGVDSLKNVESRLPK
jgi:hypothetical protein